MTDKELIFFQKQLLNLGASQQNQDFISLAEAKFCYLTREQSEEWIRIGTFSNVHTHSPELQLISDNIQDIRLLLNKRLSIVDLGCGDGKKIPPLVKILSKEFDVQAFLAIDTSKYLLETALSHVREYSGLAFDYCLSYQVDFEDISISEINNFFSETARLYTFLGNTFNNFPRDQITQILSNLMEKDDQALLIGVKTRMNSSIDEQNRLIKEYSSYGPRFTFSYGHILGLSDDQMQREVTYDLEENRVDIWIKVLQPSQAMINSGLSNCEKILAGYRYVPTIEELLSWLTRYFEVKVFSNATNTNAVFCCKKPRKTSE